MEKALQWWYAQKLSQLSSEANLIREQLLQESFAMRRSLELSSDKLSLCPASHQKYIEQLERFHSSLKQLSDRLFPSSLNEGLPYAIRQSSEQWQRSLNYQFQLNLPQNWLSVMPLASFVALDVLEDLLHIQADKKSAYNLVLIDLEQTVADGKTNNELKVVLSANNPSQLIVKDDLTPQNASGKDRELQYLQHMFESLTSGTCQNIVTRNTNIWLFNW